MLKKSGFDPSFSSLRRNNLWIITFADLMVILMAFFIMLFSFSEIDNQKFKQINLSIKEAFGSPIPVKQPEQEDLSAYLLPFMLQQRAEMRLVTDPVNQLEKVSAEAKQEEIRIKQAKEQVLNLKQALAEQIKNKQVEVNQDGHIITIRLLDTGAFEVGSAELSAHFKPQLIKLGELLKTVEGDIVVSGYTDNTPIHNSQYRSNWELSAARAYSVIVELTQQNGIDPERIIMRGFGEHHALTSNDTPENRALNRRVDITIDNGSREYEKSLYNKNKQLLNTITPKLDKLVIPAKQELSEPSTALPATDSQQLSAPLANTPEGAKRQENLLKILN